MSLVETDLEIIDLEAPTKQFVVSIEEQRNAMNKPELTEARKIFQLCLKYLSMLGRFLGVDVSFDWKPSVPYYFMKTLLWWFWSQLIYTQIVYTYKRDTMKVLEVFAIYGISTSNVLNLICFDKYFKNITALMKSTMKICQENTGLRAKKIKERVQKNLLFYKFLAILAAVVGWIYIYYPIYSYLFHGKLVPFIPVEFMFVDHGSKLGFLIASFIQAILGAYALSGDLYMAYVLVYSVMDYRIRVDITEIDFKELDDLWNETSTSTLSYRHMYLRNICRKYIDMSYIAEIKNIFDDKIFGFFFFAYCSQILCLYEIRVNDWITGYSIAIGLFLEMIFFCCLGSLNDRLCYFITQSHWYQYDEYSRKLILSLLSLAMNYDELWIGPFKPLNVYTAQEMIRSIYSYYTLMTELL